MGLAKTAPLPAAAPAPEPPADLLAALRDERPEQRRLAARQLRHQPGHAAEAGRHLLGETDHAVREMLFNSLVAIGDDRAAQALIPLLAVEHDANLRNGAIEALKQLPTAIAPHMRDLLRDPDPDRRIFAVNICESLRSPEVEQWLIEVIEIDLHLNVCATAVDLLGEIGGEAAVAPLRRLSRRFGGEPFLGFAVATALRRIGAAPEDAP